MKRKVHDRVALLTVIVSGLTTLTSLLRTLWLHTPWWAHPVTPKDSAEQAAPQPKVTDDRKT